MTCIRNWLEKVLLTLSSDSNSLQQALTVKSGTSTIHSVSHILFSRLSLASGFSSRLRTYSTARARSSGVEGPRILAAHGSDAALVRTIRTAKSLRTIMPAPLEVLGWARWVLKSYSGWGWLTQAGTEFVNQLCCNSSRSTSGLSQLGLGMTAINPWSVLLGGSPRIYAGGGALQRSGKSSALIKRFSARHREIPGLKPISKSTPFLLD